MTNPATAPTDFLSLLRQRCRIDPRRVQRARDIQAKGWVAVTKAAPDHLEARVSGNYDAAIHLQGGLTLRCTCPDFQKRGAALNQPCKHILALALHVDSRQTVQPAVAAPPGESPTPPQEEAALPDFETDGSSFSQRVQTAIGQAIARLADLVEACLRAGEIPFLIGPTGSGKTSAVRLVAARNGWAFEEVAGAQSFADADLLGLRTDHMEQPGVLARSFRRARNGETVLCFFDEALRFSARALDLLMRPLQVTPASAAQAMAIPADEPVRLVEAPLWGVDWAPADRVHLALAANPWGSQPDPALIRRVWPLPVDLDEDLLALFDSPLADAIRASWHGVRQGELPLPIEYQALARARHPRDAAILRAYLVRLAAVDKPAADGFRTLLEGMGITAAGGS